MTTRNRQVVALVGDLMDRSKITAAAGDAEVVCKAPTPGAVAGLDLGAVDLVVVDLARPTSIAAVEAVRARTDARIVGFGSHVDRERLADAEAAGSTEVLPRSKFFGDLSAVLG